MDMYVRTGIHCQLITLLLQHIKNKIWSLYNSQTKIHSSPTHNKSQTILDMID